MTGNIIVSSGQTQTITGGPPVSNSIILAHGGQYVFQYGIAVGTVVSRGGFVELGTGGTENDLTLSSGALMSMYGGQINGLTADKGASITLGGGARLVASSGTAIDAHITVNGYGEIEFAGGSISDLTINGFVTESFASGAIASGRAAGPSIRLTASSGGRLIDTKVNGSGLETVVKGGIARRYSCRRGRRPYAIGRHRARRIDLVGR